jgi:hypothetical protein
VITQRTRMVCALIGTYCAFSYVTHSLDRVYQESNRLVRAGCLSAWMCMWARVVRESLGLWPPVVHELALAGAI